MNTIRSEEAYKQGIDFSPLYPVFTPYRVTDGDLEGILPNQAVIKVEVKKDTIHHNIEEIINSPQWEVHRAVAKESVYLIYVVHQEEINKDIMINSANTIVKYVEQYGKAIEFPAGISLYDYLNKIGARDAYFILVKYPETNVTEMAIKSPEENQKWSIPLKQAYSGQCVFKTEKECIEYIKKRYEKEFNQKNSYSIYYTAQNGDRSLIHEYTYPETKRL